MLQNVRFVTVWQQKFRYGVFASTDDSNSIEWGMNKDWLEAERVVAARSNSGGKKANQYKKTLFVVSCLVIG